MPSATDRSPEGWCVYKDTSGEYVCTAPQKPGDAMLQIEYQNLEKREFLMSEWDGGCFTNLPQEKLNSAKRIYWTNSEAATAHSL